MKRLTIILMQLLALASCMGSEEGYESDCGFSGVKLNIIAPAVGGTRSSVSAPEDGINSLLVLFYENGQLVPALTANMSCGGASHTSLDVSLEIGREYEVLVFANCLVPRVPRTLTQAGAMNYTCNSINGWSDGIPMAQRISLKVRYAMPDVNVALVRLAAKLDLSIDTSLLQHGTLEFTSIAVRQMNCRCPYFGAGIASSAGGVCDGDLASASDLQRINAEGAGFSASFYLLENLQGDILEGNSDPDLKIPSSVTAAGHDPGLCTYIEILGTYSDRSGHLTSENLVSHLFLGSDALGNFDLERNHRYVVSVTITDDGCLRTDWKINGYLEDTRLLAFVDPDMKIGKSENKVAALNTNLSLAEGDYSYEVTGDIEDIAVVPSAGGFTVSTGAQVRNGKAVTITATTWDGALSTACTVTAKVDPRFILQMSDTLYTAQKCTIHVIDKEGAPLNGHLQLYVSNDYVSLEGSGNTWVLSALSPGFDLISIAYDNIVMDYKRVDVLPPMLLFPSSRIVLPLDGTPVECGPFFYKRDGVTRLYYEDFDPVLYAANFGFTVQREYNSLMYGNYWGSNPGGGNPAVDMYKVSGPCDSYAFRIGRLSSGGRSIRENYGLDGGPVLLERITARIDDSWQYIVDNTAELYVEDPFAEPAYLGSLGSWAPAFWQDSVSHDEEVDYEFDGLLAPGNDCSYASMVPESGCGHCDFIFPDRNTLRMLIHYDAYGMDAIPDYSISLVPRITNRNSGEIYESWKRFTARCSVNLGVGGVTTPNGSGGCNVSVEWTFPRPSSGPLASLEDVVVGTGNGYVRGMYTPLYSLTGNSDAIHASYQPSYKFCIPGAATSASNMTNSDSYAIPLSAGQGHRFVVWKYSNLYPSSNGWLDR